MYDFREILRFPKSAKLFAAAPDCRLACAPNDRTAAWIAFKLKCAAYGVIPKGRCRARYPVLTYPRRAVAPEGTLVRPGDEASEGARSTPADVLIPQKRKGPPPSLCAAFNLQGLVIQNRVFRIASELFVVKHSRGLVILSSVD